MPESDGIRRNVEVDYERTDVSLSAIGIVALVILLLLGVAPLIMISAFPGVRGDVDRHLAIAPPAPRLQTDPAADLGAYVSREQHLLTSYGWVDRGQGIVRVPIQIAMERLARTGIPGFPQTDPPQEPRQPAQPPGPRHRP